MEHLLVVVLPLALAGAISPVMLTEQTVLLAGPGGRRVAWSYAAGVVAVTAAVLAAVVMLGVSVSLPRLPRLDAWSDVAVGFLLVALGALVRRRRGHAPERSRPRRRLGPLDALGLGVVSMATNVTSLALLVPAGKEVAAAGLPAYDAVVAAALVALVVALPAWGPVALATAAPGTAAVLQRAEQVLHRHGRTLVVVVLVVAGAALALRGAVRLLGA